MRIYKVHYVRFGNKIRSKFKNEYHRRVGSKTVVH